MIRVLVVDDSGFFRRRIVEILEADDRLQVVGTAANGREAIQKVMELKPDVVTMDIEMPVMDGITAVKRIMKLQPTPIPMFSSLSYEGAQATLDALEAGATDFLPKRFDDISNDKQEARNILCNRVKALAGQKRSLSSRISALTQPASPSPGRDAARPLPTTRPGAAAPASPAPAVAPKSGKKFNPGDYDLVAIGTSTGGPVALQEVLTQLPQNFALPMVLVQHMPATFTEAFANRLNQLCKITVREAKDGDFLEPGLALLAPGGKQLVVLKRGSRLQVSVREETNPLQNYKPCVDVTFESIANTMGGRVLGIILTGMGADGREGCNKLKLRGSSVWAQDEATSTIYGMPAAVASIAEQILPLKEIGKKLALNT
ncbi:MAG: chemotaxis response regulator protein-glutamate methylesterase [Gammaproteobacteria bacterium]|nr:MAG: chemotaxis response regulator protein-glutamate methylesterase [Gammaproteobacteria bacterium]